MYRPGSEFLAVERLTPKDQYETPAHIWRHAVATHALDYDMHASSLNAVLPSYGTRAGTAGASGARCWLNPAYGFRCKSIGDALEACVWQRGCAVVALLPALMHTEWCAASSMHAPSPPRLAPRLDFHVPSCPLQVALFRYARRRRVLLAQQGALQ